MKERAQQASNQSSKTEAFTGEDVFQKQADLWWQPDGPFWPLHKMNKLRQQYIIDHIINTNGTANNLKPLQGLRVLDIGCGGGLLSETLHKNGAMVVGIDAVEKNINIAQQHAQQMGYGIDYRHTTAAKMAAQRDKYDVVIAMEVIEHVDDQKQFVADLAKLTNRGGLVFTSTINRTAMSLVCAKFAAEYILKLLPKGTHSWRQFVKPEEQQRYFENNGCKVLNVQGIHLNIFKKQFSFAKSLAMNYIITARKGL